MRKIASYLLITLLSQVTIVASTKAQSQKLTIKAAIDLALANNRSLRSDSLEISITESKNRELAGLYKPQASYSNNIEFNPAIPSQMLPGKFVGQPDKDYVPVTFGSSYGFKSGIEVTQTLYRKDLRLQIKAAGLQTTIAKTKYNLSKEELIYQVAGTFYTLQNNAEMIRSTYFDYQNLAGVLKIAKAQYEYGVLKRIDYESLEISVANKQSSLDQLQTQYNDQLAYFNYLLGLPASAETVIEDRISEDIHAVEGGKHLLQRTDIRLSYQMIESKEEEIKKIRAEKLPVISSYFRYSYQAQFNDAENIFNTDYWFNSSTVGISMSIPILDGKRRKSRLNTAQIQLEQLKLQNKYQQEKAEMEFFSASGTLNNNRKQYQVNQKNLALAERVFASRKALYTEGVTTLVELLDAETELSQARTLYMQSLINVQTGWLDVHKAKGTLLTDYLKAL
ncbi:MAG: TolC family protein [Chitinophagaceae bacterium]